MKSTDCKTAKPAHHCTQWLFFLRYPLTNKHLMLQQHRMLPFIASAFFKSEDRISTSTPAKKNIPHWNKVYQNCITKKQKGKNKDTKQLSGSPNRESSKHIKMYICSRTKCIKGFNASGWTVSMMTYQNWSTTHTKRIFTTDTIYSTHKTINVFRMEPQKVPKL